MDEETDKILLSVQTVLNLIVYSSERDRLKEMQVRWRLPSLHSSLLQSFSHQSEKNGAYFDAIVQSGGN